MSSMVVLISDPSEDGRLYLFQGVSKMEGLENIFWGFFQYEKSNDSPVIFKMCLLFDEKLKGHIA